MDIPKKSSSCNRAPADFQQNKVVAEALERTPNDMLDNKEVRARDAVSEPNDLALSVDRAVAKYEGRLHRLNEWFDSETKRVPAHITPWICEFNKRKNSLESWNRRKLRMFTNDTPVMPVIPIPPTDRVECATPSKPARSKVASSASPVHSSSNIDWYTGCVHLALAGIVLTLTRSLL